MALPTAMVISPQEAGCYTFLTRNAIPLHYMLYVTFTSTLHLWRFLGYCLWSWSTVGHRQMMNPSVMNLQHRLVLELSVGLSFDQRQAQWRIDLFWQQLQALSSRSCRSLARNLHSSGYTQSTCSQGGGPCEGFEKRWRTTTTSVRGV